MALGEIERAILAARGTIVRQIVRDPPTLVPVTSNEWSCDVCGHGLRYDDCDRAVAFRTARDHGESEHRRVLTLGDFEKGEVRSLPWYHS